MLSSLKLTSFNALGLEETKKVRNVWQALQDSNDSAEFRFPVEWERLGLIDYLTIVKNPMDLNTVNQKLSNNQYTSVQEALDDLQLIWDNCKLYNQKGSWIYDLAEKLERLFKRMVKTHLPMISIAGVNPKNPNSKTQSQQIKPEQKLNFVQRIKNLKAEQLGTLVAKIQELSPNAFRQVEDDRAQIVIDHISLQNWKKIILALQDLQQSIDDLSKRQKN